MKDIDFDELDKAVNSLMASTAPQGDTTTTPAPVSTEPVINVPAEASAPSPTVATNEQTDTGAATPVVVTAAQPTADVRSTAPAIRRSGGRFMDMVNTPSDSRQRPVSTSSRVGVTISPRSETSQPVNPDAPDAVDASTAGNSQVLPVSEVQPEVTPKPAVMDTMPDPLDMMANDTSASNLAAVEAQAPAAAVDLSAPAASESPFLTDTKVEKRPLNAGAMLDSERPAEPTSDSPADLTREASDTSNEPDDSRATDEPPAKPQVPELDNQLVAIESGANTVAPVEAPAMTAAGPAAAIPLGATSIPQQYSSQPSSGDQSHAAIYDTSQYPEALKHPTKSKSGWLWVLWVIILLGVGAGGAFALYSMGIIP